MPPDITNTPDPDCECFQTVRFGEQLLVGRKGAIEPKEWVHSRNFGICEHRRPPPPQVPQTKLWPHLLSLQYLCTKLHSKSDRTPTPSKPTNELDLKIITQLPLVRES